MPNKILPTSVVGAASFININSVCYQKVGTTTAATNQASYSSAFTGCADCMCPDCSGDPSMLLTVTGAVGPINWCGETWSLPNDSGITKCVCPSSYTKVKNASSAYHVWQIANYIKMERFFTSIGNTDRGVLKISFDTTFGYSMVTGFGFTTQFFPGSPVINEGDPVSATSVTANPMPDSYFFSYTANNIKYEWEKGAGW